MDGGVYALWKPKGVTSQWLLNGVKRQLGLKRVGHSGTLDPIAEGVMIVAAGSFTRLLKYLTMDEKSYEATLVLGLRTDTYDTDGTVLSRCDPTGIDLCDVSRVALEFVGDIEQVPPRYSAIHVNGKRAYDLARDGVEFTLPSRRTTIHSISVRDAGEGQYRLSVRVSSGTYVRSLIHDIGERLGVGATMTDLVRTAVGHITSVSAIEVSQIKGSVGIDPQKLFSSWLHLEMQSEYIYKRVCNGQSVNLGELMEELDGTISSERIGVLADPVIDGMSGDGYIALYSEKEPGWSSLFCVGKLKGKSFCPELVLGR